MNKMLKMQTANAIEVLPNKHNLKAGTYPGSLSGSTIEYLYHGFKNTLELENVAVRGINILCRIEITQEQIAVHLS